jgi:hypothetical protein
MCLTLVLCPLKLCSVIRIRKRSQPVCGRYPKRSTKRNRTGTKRPSSTCHADSGQMAAGTNQRGKVTGSSCSYVKEDGGGRDEEEDSNPSLVTGASIAWHY